MVCSFFLCLQSLSFMAFSAEGIHVRLFVFAMLALVSGYQCISQFLVSCYVLAAHQLHPWRFELDFFSKLVTLWTALQIPFWSKSHLVFRHKVYEIALSKVLATQMAWLWHSIKVSSFNCTNLTRFFLTVGQFHWNSCIVILVSCLWVVTICCNTVWQ